MYRETKLQLTKDFALETTKARKQWIHTFPADIS